MTDPQLQLVPASARSRFWLLFLSVVVPTMASVLLMALAGHQSGLQRLFYEGGLASRWLGPWIVAAFTAVVWWILDLALRRQHLCLDRDALTVAAGFHRDRVALSDLQLAQARVLDMDEHPRRRPLLKTNGMSLPGYRSGWFRSRDLQKLFVATAGGERLLWLPTTRGHVMLLQPRNPQLLLDRLRALAPAPPRR